jgi:hypothetical protein
LKQAAPQDKADAAKDVADAAREKHDAILDVLEPKVPDEAKPALERAKEEEHKDQGDNGNGPKKTDAPGRSRTSEPARTPRPTETSRATKRP